MKKCNADARCHECTRPAAVELGGLDFCHRCLSAALALLAPPPAPPADVREKVRVYGAACENYGEMRGHDKAREALDKSIDAAEAALLAAYRPPAEAGRRVADTGSALLGILNGGASDGYGAAVDEFAAALAAYRARYPKQETADAGK